ncbi:cell division protein FtsK [Streptomyces yaizuensis]|uniref:Cell division protein FtsK n=1 Tax=Streptomyces yaizuensis TaxID=2989713 RepID=A0ABQ5P6S7_9ACTN|nr:cell division protein FtsK [Streptomyces sp. YSPA8]GLF98284.1 cell division protein FtsK [Streptomyces sp. YSPA8]
MTTTTLRNSVRPGDRSAPALLTNSGLLIGLAADDRPVTLPHDGGHVLVAAGSGGGTTTVLRSLAAQALVSGARTDILDLSHCEHSWADALPGARHLHDAAAIHDYLLIAAADLNSAPRVAPATGWGARRVLIVEELSRLADALRGYWIETRPETQLQEAPGVEALALLLASGRAYGWTVIAGDTGGTVPGPGPLHHRHFPTRVLGYGRRLWLQLAPGHDAPPYSHVTGRFHLVAGNTATPFQALYLTEAQATTLASTSAPGTEQQGCA